MADIKISQLTAKGATISSTDLIEISESNGAGGYITKSVTGANIIGSKQDTLVSGTNIKTLNSNSILGSGDLAVQPTLISGTNIKTIEGQSILGGGNINITNSDVGLGNVDNTSDLNKPISTATQTALNAKQNTITNSDSITEGVTNLFLTTGERTKLTNTSGTNTGDQTNITGTADNVTGIVAVANGGTGTATPSLVAGTNVTITGTFPNQTIAASGGGSMAIGGSITSATAGSVLFAGTSGVLQQDNANLFWDDSNNRLGIGTATPSFKLDVVGTGTANGQSLVRFTNPTNFNLNLALNSTGTTGNTNFGFTVNDVTQGAVGWDRTDNSIFFWNSIANAAYVGMKLRSDGNTSFFKVSDGTENVRFVSSTGNVLIGTTTDAGYKLDVNGTARIQNKLSVGTPSAASAVLEVSSTTQGFLPPKMTTTQKNAIATPAAGLIVYDTTDNKHYGYNGTTWNAFY